MTQGFAIAIFILFASLNARADFPWTTHVNGLQTHTRVQFVRNTLPPRYAFPVTRLSSKDIQNAFDRARALPLPFEHVKECCFDRGYRISEALAHAGISHLRVFVRGDQKFGPFTDKWNRSYIWEVHTAPALVDTQNQIWILDPATSKSAVLLRDWLVHFADFRAGVTLTIASHFTYSEDDLNDTYATTFDRPNVQEVVQGFLLGCEQIQKANNERWNPQTKTLTVPGGKK